MILSPKLPPSLARANKNTKQSKFCEIHEKLWCVVWRGVAAVVARRISLCPWHMFAQTQAAIVQGCLRRRGASLHVEATTAVAVCWHLMAMFKPIKLNKQWSIEGGAYRSKPIGLDTRDVDTASGPVSFVKLENTR